MHDDQLDAVLRLEHISFVRNERRILDDVTFRVHPGEHWLVLGANGSGKTTLLRIASMYEHPSTGTVHVLGEQLGRTDVRVLRRRVGYASAALAAQFRTDLTATDVVMTAKYAALEPWWHRYNAEDRARAVDCLDRMEVGAYRDRSIATLSSGEQQRVFLARTLMNDPDVILLDEPSARLDLGGREQLVAALDVLATQAAPFVLVTHHVDEVPAGVTHALLLRDGSALAQGPIAQTLTSDTLSDCFRMPLQLERRGDGRLTAWRLSG
ncbi:MAG TPA: ATP-binding cassette domain-containing protein [Ilumatobacter sp.]|nr:ATP-binding cassette domain-containing protein [Ilumatobacter sp.]